MKRASKFLGLALVFAACGESDGPSIDASQTDVDEPVATSPTAAPRPSGPMTVPEWFDVDAETGDVRMSITAGATPTQNYWNFNGYTKGALVITVPEGATVTIDFTNRDPVMAHSLGISSELRSFAMPPAPNPVFPGAMTEDPASMISSTLPGESETIQFVADQAGSYSMVCYIAGHTAVGMWLFFDVSATGAAGVQGL